MHPAEQEEFLPQLAAVRLSADQVHPGDTLISSYEWVNVGKAPAEEEYTVLIHVRPAKPGDPDISPATGGDFRPSTPTFAWLPHILVQERDHPVRIPEDFPPGKYRLLIGLYSQETGQRHRLANNDLAVPGLRYGIASLEVVPKGTPLTGRPITLRWHDTQGLPQGVVPALAPSGKTIELDSGKMRVALSAERPMVLGYEVPGRMNLPGDSSGFPLRVRIGRTRSGAYRTICLGEPASFSLHQRPAEARYTVHVSDQGTRAATFDLVFRVQGNVLRAGIESVREEPGYLLMDVFTPQLVSTRGPMGQLVCPPVRASGSLGPFGSRLPRHRYELDGDGPLRSRSRGWSGRGDPHPRLGQRVGGASDRTGGAVGGRLRGPAGPAGGSRREGGQDPSGGNARCRSGDPRRRGDGKPPTWIEAAKWLRQGISGSPNPLYQDTYIYKIFCDSPGAGDYTTFEDALSVIRRVHQLAPWLKQVVYLVGWQYRGHDTGYPATDQINRRLGGIEGLRRAAADTRPLAAQTPAPPAPAPKSAPPVQTDSSSRLQPQPPGVATAVAPAPPRAETAKPVVVPAPPTPAPFAAVQSGSVKERILALVVEKTLAIRKRCSTSNLTWKLISASTPSSRRSCSRPSAKPTASRATRTSSCATIPRWRT